MLHVRNKNLIGFFVLILMSFSVYSGEQIITPSPSVATVSAGGSVVIDVYYSTANPVSDTLTGLGLYVHYDSSKLTFVSLTSVLSKSPIANQTGQVDTNNIDGNAATDEYALVSWADPFNNQWPNSGLANTLLFTANFIAKVPNSQATISFSASSTTNGYTLLASPATINIIKLDQTITFTAPANDVIDSSATLSATTDSGLAVNFSSNTPNICSVIGDTVSYLAAGTCTILADQAGNATYKAATQVSGNTNVGKLEQTISFLAPASGLINGSATLSATADSGLTVTFSTNTNNICSVIGDTVSYLSTGTCTILADQAGNATYNAATQVSGNTNVGKLEQTISLLAPADGPVNGSATLSATADSGLAVTFSSNTNNICSVIGDTVSYLSTGTCTILADQAGNATYNAATQVSGNIQIAKRNQIITFTPPVTASIGDTLILTASSDLGLAVSYSSGNATICSISGNTVMFLTLGTCVIYADQTGDISTNPAPQVSISVSISSSAEAPIVTAPADVTVNSTGLLTIVTLGEATVIGNIDGTLIATPDNTGPFSPGIHTVLWSVTDLANNTGTASQKVTVIPQVVIGPNQTAAPDSIVTIPVILNGTFPNDVSVGYNISRSSNLDIVEGNVTILTGSLESNITFNTNDYIEDEDISINLHTPVNAVIGLRNSSTVLINANNIEPSVQLIITQGEIHSRTLTQVDGDITITALVTDANSNDTHSFDWSMTDNELVDTDLDTTNNVFIIDPSALEEDDFKVYLYITDSGVPALSIRVKIEIRIKSNHSELHESDDSDDDGITDDIEGHGDDDDDGIPNYLDVHDLSNVMPANSDMGNSPLLETEPGLKITLGTTAFLSGGVSADLTQEDITIFTEILNGSSSVDEIENIGGFYDFDIEGLTELGQSVAIVLPLRVQLPEKAVYRELLSTGWQSFTEDGKNILRSATGAQGVCPPPGDASYSDGLTPGDWCIQLTIEDGGPNDADGIANRTIEDPSGVGIRSVVPIDNVVNGGGGSIISSVTKFDPTLLILLFLSGVNLVRRSYIK